MPTNRTASPDFGAQVSALIEAPQELREPKSNHASKLGDPCDRYLVLYRSRWAEAKPRDPEIQWIFRRGNDLENLHGRLLMEAASHDGSWRVYKPPVLQDRVLDDLNIGWKLDYLVQVGDQDYPLEVKAIHPYSWDKLNTLQDFYQSTSRYTRRYPAQLMLYMVRRGRDRGVFYLVNGLTWKPKSIWVDLDYEYAERLLKRAEMVNGHLKAGTTPGPCDERHFCPACDFFHVCLPDLTSDVDEIVDTPEAVTDMERFFELKPAAAELKKLKERLKDTYARRARVLIGGRFMTESKLRSRKEYTVQAKDYWDTRYKELKAEDDEGDDA